MFDSLRQTLETLCPLTDAEWAVFRSCLQEKIYAKNDSLLNAGHVCQGTWFINRGAIRSYTMKDGSDVHTNFSFETDYVTDYESLTKQQPSTLTIIALERAETIYFGRNDLIDLYRRTPTLMQLGRTILENVVIYQSQYASLFTLYSSAERYDHLLRHHPQIVQRVPVQYIASYLGMARETLSRIRRKK